MHKISTGSEDQSTASGYFSSDYDTARSRFLMMASKAGASLDRLAYPIEETGSELTTDIAWLGPRQPKNALVLISGFHGVEGFAGSAIQLSTLDQPPRLADETALVMIHIVNPYGMKYLRRVNQNNVDLNRNLQIDGSGWLGAPEKYPQLNPFLNPKRPPRLECFHLKLLLACARYGYPTVRQTIAGGQHLYPKGMFYGGAKLEPEAAGYFNWLKKSGLFEVDNLAAVDLHTGIGAFGEQSLFMRAGPVAADVLSERLGLDVTPNLTGKQKALGYGHTGSNSDMFRHCFKGKELTCLTVEYGTYSGRHIFYALRVENQQHHYGGRDLSHWAKRKVKNAFCPDSEIWKNRVVEQGSKMVQKVCSYLDKTE